MPRRLRHPAGHRSKIKRYELEARNKTVFHGLPTETVLKILHFAAAASQRSCLALCRVSSWTRRLALPYLYTTPVLRSKYTTYLFADAFRRAAAAVVGGAEHHWDPLPLVRGVWMQDAKRPEKPSWFVPFSVLQGCQNLEHIAAGDRILLNLSMPGIVLPRPLRQGHGQLKSLTVTGKATTWYSITCNLRRGSPHFLETITHLHFLSAYDVHHQLDISVFPHLTHLALPVTATCLERTLSPPFWCFREVLNSSTMQMLVLVVYPKDRREIYRRFDIDGWVRATRRTDRRAFILEQQFSQVKDDWRMEANGGNGVWGRAIAFTRGWEAASAHNDLSEVALDPGDISWRS